ncbi:MAG: nucleotidyltransferase domain-containing protein [Nanoarchaeota archaeon]|nr:nucleotidyltransferase domain-containing protein [Nanoarchaeota archaeon]
MVYDVILFGSFVKGKTEPQDIDVAVISDKKIFKFKNYHVSIISLEDFFKPIGLVNTLIREGYSLKKNKPFSEVYGFKNKCLFRYELSDLSASKKVQVVNFLRGRKGEKGLVLEKEGEWVSNQVFLCPVIYDSIFDKFFMNAKIKFRKYYVLID